MTLWWSNGRTWSFWSFDPYGGPGGFGPDPFGGPMVGLEVLVILLVDL